MQKPSVVRILNVDVDRVDFEQTLTHIEQWIEQSRAADRHMRQICTVNPEFIMAARQDPSFAQTLLGADLRAPDGVGILWAAALLGKPLHERVTGSDGLYRICQRAAERGWRVYLLGAAPGVAQRAAAHLQATFPGLNVAGCDDGNPTLAEWPQIQQRLLAAHVDILFVAYGHPRQDLWINQHRAELPVKVAIGVGGAFDFAAGHKKRAPHWMRRLGIEWLYRLWLEPWRWRRMLVLPHFALLVLWQWAKAKINPNRTYASSE